MGVWKSYHQEYIETSIKSTVIMIDVNVVFCIVTYKNYVDIEEFAISLKKRTSDFSFRVVVVNNYADQSSMEKIKQVSMANGFDFIENENKGYSHGNNVAIKFALQKYRFEYLIVSNADVELTNLKLKRLKKFPNAIIAPEIKCTGRKRQNPLSYHYLPLSEYLICHGFRMRFKYLLYLGIILNKLNRLFMQNMMKIRKKDTAFIYACHGSFIVFPNTVIKKLAPVFDDQYFLFFEERDLAKKAKAAGIKIIFDIKTKVFHKEDGSMDLSDKNLFEIHRQSAIYYFEKWYGRNK